MSGTASEDILERLAHLERTYNAALDKKDAEIERLKAQHEAMLLKHAREQGAALEALEAALVQLQAQKGLLVRAAAALSKGPFHPQYKLELAKELRKAGQ